MTQIKKILVTGGSGFLGSHVCDELSSRGHKVTIYDKVKSSWANIKKQKIAVGRLNNFKLLESLIKKNDYVFHFAGLANLDEAVKKPIETVKDNIEATVQLLQICKKHKIKRFIYASSVYANSSDGGFYSISKRAAENYIDEFFKSFGLKYTILRFGSLFGTRAGKDNGIRKIIEHTIKKKEIYYGGEKNSIRRYINVRLAAKLTSNILNKKFENRYILIVGKNKIKIKNLLSIIKKKFDIKKKIIYKKNELIGHYTKMPKKYKSIIGKPYFIKKKCNFKKEIFDYIEYLKYQS